MKERNNSQPKSLPAATHRIQFPWPQFSSPTPASLYPVPAFGFQSPVSVFPTKRKKTKCPFPQNSKFRSGWRLELEKRLELGKTFEARETQRQRPYIERQKLELDKERLELGKKIATEFDGILSMQHYGASVCDTSCSCLCLQIIHSIRLPYADYNHLVTVFSNET